MAAAGGSPFRSLLGFDGRPTVIWPYRFGEIAEQWRQFHVVYFLPRYQATGRI
jgi:hypothetical protein